METSVDDLDELEETFTVTLDSPDGASVDDGSGTGTIEDGADDTPPELSIADAEAVEEGGTARFVVTLSPESGREVTVEYQTSDDTAEAGSDYVATMGTLTFTAGTTTQTIEVETSEDDLDEANETLTVGLRDPEGATLNGDTGIGTITDDDDPPIVSIEDATAVQEGGTALFEVTLNEASGREVTVMYRTVAGSALAESDYTAVSGQLTFEPGTLQQTVAVGTVDDGVSESEESFTVELHDPGEASVSTSRGTGTGTIIDNDELPVVSVADATPVSEGDAATFAVTLNEESGREVTVFFQTVNGTAIAGSDYASDSGTLTFSAGDMEQTITVSTLDDNAPEDPESFTVELSSPSGATVGKGVASGTIRDDDVSDPLSSLSIGDVESVDEGDTAEFTVTLTPASSRLVTVSYETEDGTALAGSDYASVSGTLTFAANETAKTIQVSVLNDETRESSETFTMELRNPAGATLQDGSAVATIRDDDSDKLPSLSIDDAAAVDEPGTAEFLVRLSAPAGETGVRVDYGTVDGTALAGSDYRSEAGTLTFAANESTKTIRVSVLDDDTAEQVENFRVELENAVGATLLHRIGEGTINANDPEETFSLLIRDAPAVPEGGTALFRVMLSASSDQDVSVTYETVDGTALSGTDYTPTRGTLSFGAGTTMLTIAVRTLDDDIREQSEAFTVELSDPVGAVLERASGTGTISDDDEEELPGLSIRDAPAVDEGDTAEFVATLSAASESEVTATYRTVDGTAQGGVDYESATGTLRFDAGVTEQTLSVSVLDDEMAESEESFSVELSNPQGATLEKSTATGTILDDDEDEVVPRGPSIAVADAAPVAEGGMAEFVVTLSTAGDETVSVSYSTADGTAIASADYESSAGTLEFAAGETSKTIAVRTVDDEIREEDEEFMVELSNPQGARLVSSTGTGTILDDDEDRLPALSIADADAVGEGETAEFVVTLSAASDQEVSMSYRSVDGTAVAGSDYETVTGTLRFEAGVTEGTISVSVLDDASAEAEEHFTVKLDDASGATFEDDSGVGTIVDDDEDGVVPRGPTISVADATPVTEGGTAEFEVRLDRTSGAAVSVSYATRDGTAAAGSDYEASSGTLSFAPGESRKTISVATIEDEVPEGTERFTVHLSESQGATLESDTGTATIVDDDEDEIVDEPPPTLSIADAAPVDEGDTARFAVDLDRASDGEVTVSYSTMDGTAQAGADYASAAGTLTFVAGETAKTISVAVLDDESVEGRERFTVRLRNPVGATLADATATGTIVGDVEEHVDSVNDAILPQMGRAMAFTPVRCRMDQVFGDAAAGATRPAGRLSLSPLPGEGGRDGVDNDAQTSLEALGDTSFLVPLKDSIDGAEHLAAWGCGDFAALAGDGGNGDIDWDGLVSTVQVGADLWLSPYLLTGLSMAQSFGSLDYRTEDIGAGASDGEREMWLTGLHSYIAWAITPDTNLWWTLGHSWGRLDTADDLLEGRPGSDATLASAAFGFGTRLAMRKNTTFTLKGEGAVALMDVDGAEAMFGSLSMDLARLRLSTEAKRTYDLAAGGVLIPWGELGLRYDGGHGENGSGLEVGAGVRYRVPAVGWAIEGGGRWLAVDQGALRRDWGLHGLARFNPGPSELGPSASLSLAWGESASGVQRLWESDAAASGRYGVSPGRYEARFAYGLPALQGRGVWTPYWSLTLGAEYGRGYRMGSRFDLGQYATMNLEAERRKRPDATAIHSVLLRGAVEF